MARVREKPALSLAVRRFFAYLEKLSAYNRVVDEYEIACKQRADSRRRALTGRIGIRAGGQRFYARADGSAHNTIERARAEEEAARHSEQQAHVRSLQAWVIAAQQAARVAALTGDPVEGQAIYASCAAATSGKSRTGR